MEIKTYDTILSQMCDSFDTLISPLTIERANTNVIYLILKACAKGLEIINNVCVVLSNKFDPVYCSEEDLESSAMIVGTEKLKGSATGLKITAKNKGEENKILLAGNYYYALDEETKFEFEVIEDKLIQPNERLSFIAMSENIGQFPVTQQENISVTSSQTIADDISFSCEDNSSLLGYEEETNLEFRERIQYKTDRQNFLTELETDIRNLPYVFDCKLKYNETEAPVYFDNIVIPPYTLCVFYSGEIKNEVADKVCEKVICPTLETSDSTAVYYQNPILAGDKYAVHLIPFKKEDYSVELIYKIDKTFISEEEVKERLDTALMNNFVTEKHIDYITEDDFYNVIEKLNIQGFVLLGVNLMQNNTRVDFVEVLSSRIPCLTSVTHSVRE